MQKQITYNEYINVLDGDDNVRANILYGRLLRKQRYIKHIHGDSYIGNYVSSKELRTILGRHKYHQTIESLIKSGVLEILDIKNRFGYQLYYTKELPELSYEKKQIESKRVINSIDNLRSEKYRNLSKEAKHILKNLQKITINIDKDKFNKSMDKHFSTIGGHFSFEQRKNICEHVWNMIVRFNETKDKNEIIDFISEDDFGHRVHSIVSIIPRVLRQFIEIDGEETVEIDLKSSQPNILSETLKKSIGDNDFSETMQKESDIYVYLQHKLNIEDRDSAKKRLYSMIFGTVRGSGQKTFDKLFPIAAKEIKKIKSKRNEENPSRKIYSNLAFLMQRTEREMFGKIWKNLIRSRITFVTVHDSIICKKSELSEVYFIMESVLNNYFEKYQLSLK